MQSARLKTENMPEHLPGIRYRRGQLPTSLVQQIGTPPQNEGAPRSDIRIEATMIGLDRNSPLQHALSNPDAKALGKRRKPHPTCNKVSNLGSVLEERFSVRRLVHMSAFERTASMLGRRPGDVPKGMARVR